MVQFRYCKDSCCCICQKVVTVLLLPCDLVKILWKITVIATRNGIIIRVQCGHPTQDRVYVAKKS